jgi:hypothetical protein
LLFLITGYRSIGSTFLLAAAQSGFANQLAKRLAHTAPNVTLALVTATGATELRQAFPRSELDGVLRAYAWGVKVAFALTIAACGITVVVNMFRKWNNINKVKVKAAGA